MTRSPALDGAARVRLVGARAADTRVFTCLYREGVSFIPVQAKIRFFCPHHRRSSNFEVCSQATEVEVPTSFLHARKFTIEELNKIDSQASGRFLPKNLPLQWLVRLQ